MINIFKKTLDKKTRKDIAEFVKDIATTDKKNIVEGIEYFSENQFEYDLSSVEHIYKNVIKLNLTKKDISNESYRFYLEALLNPPITIGYHTAETPAFSGPVRTGLSDVAIFHYNLKYGSDCFLTGSPETGFDNVFDHFIPLSTGHVGAVLGNYIILTPELNSSKGAQNPFEWIKTNSEKYKIDMVKWDQLIINNAREFELTVEEYKEFVYWCFENPRDLEEIYNDGDISSLDKWILTF
ncbi:MAG: hypothetical protein M0T74_16520 [Desulfitobacterium hafniense]|nr:hypothetical protein [Desulfitobacterium hafniense]